MKRKNLIKLTPAMLLAITVLSGCVRRTKTGHPYGFVYEKMAVPTQHLLHWMANVLGGYGWAIIVITIVVRLILMPLMIEQSKKMTIQQEKLSFIRPELNAIQERQKKATTQEERAAVSADMMKLYRENGISMAGGIGCLPLLIQLPIFSALYAAIQYSPEISKAYFFGVNLGHRSYLYILLTFGIYVLQGWLSTLGLPADQRAQMKQMMLMSPIMTAFFTYIAPAGLGLYFFAGGIVACLQTLIVNAMRPQIRERVRKQIKGRRAQKATAVSTEKTATTAKKVATPETDKASDTNVHARNRKRNAGKQRRRK